MDAEEALLAFLRESLCEKRDRILDFASRPKTRYKFLDLIYHQLGDFFREANIVAHLPAVAWRQPAFRFRPRTDFGVPVPTLRSAYDEGGQKELVVTADARYGYWRDETYVDSETLVIAIPFGHVRRA